MTKLIGEQVLMRIFIGEGDRFEHKPLYEVLMELLRHEGFAGATVLRGVCGFGANRVCHTQKLLDLSANLPLVVEAVDCQEKINAIMPRIDAMMSAVAMGRRTKRSVGLISGRAPGQRGRVWR